MQKRRKKEKEKYVRQMLPDILCVILLVASRMAAVYVYGLTPAGNTVFYEMAEVTGRGAVPFMKHGASYIYTCFLSIVLHFLGNREECVVVVQLVIQSAMILLLYRAVRKLWGRAASLFFLASAAVLPVFLTRYGIISPDLLLCMMTAVLLLLLALLCRWMREGRKLPMDLTALLTGILAGIHLWLDATGIVVCLAVCIGIIIHRRGIPLVCVLAGMAGSLAAVFTFESVMTGISLQDTVLQYLALYFTVPGVTYMSFPAQISIAWMSEAPVRYLNLVGILEILAGSAVTGCVAHIYEKRAKGRAQADGPGRSQRRGTRKRKAKRAVLAGEETAALQENDSMERPDDEITQQEINYIPNPLPLPKKHVKKVIGFDYEPVPEQMMFDMEPEDGDDFDLP